MLGPFGLLEKNRYQFLSLGAATVAAHHRV